MKISLCVETHDGSDTIEAEVDLPIVPRIGDIIEMWDAGAPGVLGYAQTDHFPVVEQVVMSVYRPEYIRVYLRFDTFVIEEVERVMEGASMGVTP